jgi:hypothetical protein
MSEVDQETVEVEVNPVETFIDAVQAGNFVDAKKGFDSLVQDKLNNRLDAEKVAVSNSIFNNADDDIEVEDYDEDEDVNDILDEIEDELDDEDTAEEEGKQIFSGAEPVEN